MKTISPGIDLEQLDEVPGTDNNITSSLTGIILDSDETVFVVNGTVVGTVNEINNVTNRKIYKTTNPAIPLLASMVNSLESDVRATYPTTNKPIKDVESKLEGSFFGFIELSEEVVSGDYYVVFDGSKQLYVGMLGTGRLLDAEESKENLYNEVGIYDVVSVSPSDYTPVKKYYNMEKSKTEEQNGNIKNDGGEEKENVNNEPEEVKEETEETQVENKQPDTSSPSKAHDRIDEEKGVIDLEERKKPDFDNIKEKEVRDDDLDLPKEVEEELEETESVKEKTRGEVDTEEIEELRQEVERLSSDVSDLQKVNQAIATLNDKIEELEEKIEKKNSQNGKTNTSSERNEVKGPEVINNTDIFIRYKNPTKNKIQTGLEGEEREEALSNCHIDTHTLFDNEDLYVDGKEYEQFIIDRVEYKFVKWMYEELFYLIEDTGNKKYLEPLTKTIPQGRRVELDGVIELEDEEVKFDIILWNNKGEPLIVCDTVGSNEPVSEPDISNLLEKSVKTAKERNIAGCFFVSGSYYESEALKLANDEASSGGILSSKKRKAFIKLGRKKGIHLCLVEQESNGFRMILPEL